MSQGTYGDPLDVDPGIELLNEVKRTAGHVAWLRNKIEYADPEALASNYWTYKRSTESSISRTELEHDPEAQKRQYIGVWMELYQRERMHLVRACQIAIQCGIEDRKVRIVERQAEHIGRVIYGLLEDVGLDPTQPDVRTKAAKWLMQAGSTDQLILEGSFTSVLDDPDA
jgi:hypothetical protein